MVRRALILGALLVVVLIGGGFAFFALRGGDAPPPPTLSDEAPASQGSSGAYEVVAGGDAFVGYRVREEFIGFGVKDAVGRTSDVSGTATVDGDAITDRAGRPLALPHDHAR